MVSRRRVVGDAGNDFLWGGDGRDTISGGAGNDWFIFGGSVAGAGGADYVVDFETGVDTLAISVGWGPGLVSGSLTAAQFTSGWGVTQASTPEQRVIYDWAGYLYFDADGNGAAYSPALFAQVYALTAITATDVYILS